MPTTGDPRIPRARMNLVRPAHPVTARVVSNELCMRGKSASFVKHLVLDVGGSPLEGSFLPGQSFGVVAPGADEHGRPHKLRLYSIACPSWGEDGNARYLSTTPKRLIDEFRPQRPSDQSTDHRLFLGVCSNYLCDLSAGDPVGVTGPNGKRFLLPAVPDAHDYLFIATGTGIAPFRGMILELLEGAHGPCASRIELVAGVPYTTDLLYDDLFRRLARQYANFGYHTAISRESAPGETGGRYVGDLIRLQPSLFAPLLGSERTLIYMCGLLGMQHGVYRSLAELGTASPYVAVPDRLRSLPPARWSNDDLKREATATARCMLELY